MSEKREILKTAGRFAIVFLFALAYSIGGTEDMGGKWIRRYLGPAILCLGMFAYSRSWKSLIQAPVMMITLSMGYGADAEWLKIVKRAVWGACNGLSSGFNNILDKRWILVIFHMVLIIGACVAFGVYNPFFSARIEEFCIGVFIAIIPIMSAKRIPK